VTEAFGLAVCEVDVVGGIADDGVMGGGRIEERETSSGVAISTQVRPNSVGDVEGLTVRVRRNVELSGRPMKPMKPIMESKVDLSIIESQATIISTVALESEDVVIQMLGARNCKNTCGSIGSEDPVVDILTF